MVLCERLQVQDSRVNSAKLQTLTVVSARSDHPPFSPSLLPSPPCSFLAKTKAVAVWGKNSKDLFCFRAACREADGGSTMKIGYILINLGNIAIRSAEYSPGKVAFKWLIVCLSMKLLSDHIRALGKACEDYSWRGFHQKRKGRKSARVLRGSLLHLGNTANSLIGEQKRWKKPNRALCLMVQKLRATSPSNTKQFQTDDSLIITHRWKLFCTRTNIKSYCHAQQQNLVNYFSLATKLIWNRLATGNNKV